MGQIFKIMRPLWQHCLFCLTPSSLLPHLLYALPPAPCPAPDLSKYVANLKHVVANWKHCAFKTVDFSFAHANFPQEIPSDVMTQTCQRQGDTWVGEGVVSDFFLREREFGGGG